MNSIIQLLRDKNTNNILVKYCIFEKKYKERIRASNSNNYIREAYLNNDMLIVNDKKNASYKIEYEQNPNSKNKETIPYEFLYYLFLLFLFVLNFSIFFQSI